MTNEIVKLVAKKANISEPIAQVAVDTVLKFLKGKLPPVVGSALDSFLGSSSTPASSNTKKSTSNSAKSKTTSKSSKKTDNPLGDLGSIADAIGGLFGKK